MTVLIIAACLLAPLVPVAAVWLHAEWRHRRRMRQIAEDFDRRMEAIIAPMREGGQV